MLPNLNSFSKYLEVLNQKLDIFCPSTKKRLGKFSYLILSVIWIECLKACVPSVQVYYRKTGVVILKSLLSIKHYR